ncbi:nitroreductase [Streptomyces diastaticus]|uniref:Acg family FMN-binding oxidoreductase n=1 Tax=Streptomyces ardesiacus TaxID=285564 RepID=UPI0006E1F437|nr:nitroreductase [Streptomyces sp. NBRC 110030]NEB63136.1 nitroreductase [Streptomyces diastaticus]
MTHVQLDEQTVTTLVAEATTAPSMHNAQPWRFRFLAAERLLLLRADPDRAMPRSDPGNRALHIGCGAALFNLRVAAVHASLVPLTRLLPDRRDPSLLASVRLADPSEAPQEKDLWRLHPAIRQRRTSRHPFSERDIPENVRATLRDAAAREKAILLFPGRWHVETLLELVHDAEDRDLVHAEGNEDVVRWTRLGNEADTAVDGVPAYAFGPRKTDGKAPVRDFSGRRPVPGRGSAGFERTPHLALLGTRGDGPTDWLEAGQALERVLLESTLAGLSTSLTSHPLEDRELRLLARDPRSGVGHVQMVLRLGYGPKGPATPRRPVPDVLSIG